MQQISRKMKKFSGWALALLGVLCLACTQKIAQETPLYTDVYLNSINKSWQAPCGEPGTPTAQIQASLAAIPVGGILELTCYQVPITLTADIFSTVSKPILIWMPPVAVTVNANTTIPANFELCYTPGSSLTAGGGYTITDNSTPCGGGGTGPVTPNIPIAGTNGAGSVINATYTATGGVTQLARSKLAQTINILDFGADPTGATDSTAGIQGAYNLALVMGGIVVWPPGRFLVSAPITVTNTGFAAEFGYSVKVSTAGSGQTTVLNYTGAAGYALTQSAAGAPSDRNMFMSNMQVICSGAALWTANGLRLVNVSSSSLSNITVSNCNKGLTLDDQGATWSEETTAPGLRFLNDITGVFLTSSTSTSGTSFEFSHFQVWCGWNMAGYTPDACVHLDTNQYMYQSDVGIDINWGLPADAPTGSHVAAIHLGSGSDPFGTTWRITQDGASVSYLPSIFKDDGAISIGSAVYAMTPYVNAYNGGALPALYSGVEWHGMIGGKDTVIQSSVLTATKSLVGPELTVVENQNFGNLIVNGTPTLGTFGGLIPGWQTGHPNQVIASDTDPFGNTAQKVVYGTSANFTSPPGPVTNSFGIVPGDIYYVTGYYKIGDYTNVANWYFTFADGENGGYNVPVGMPAGGNPTTWTPFSFTHTVPTTALVGGPTAYLNWGNGRATSDWIELYGVSTRFAGPGPPLPIFATNEAAIAGGLTNGMEYQTGGDPSLVAVVSSITNINTVPPIPTGLTAAPGNTQNVLNWLADVGATLYNVKRSTTGGPPYTGIATVAAPTVTYTNTGLTNGTPYYYVLSASNPIGESANSAQASATPSATAPGTYRPTTFANTGNYPAVNAPAAYDGNLTTPAQVFGAIVYTPMNGDTTWSGFATTSGPWTAASLVIYSKELRAGTTPGTAILEYSLDGGSSWTAIHSTTGTWDASVTPDTVALGATQALNLVKVQAVQPAPGVGQDTILVYEIYISAY